MTTKDQSPIAEIVSIDNYQGVNPELLPHSLKARVMKAIETAQKWRGFSLSLDEICARQDEPKPVWPFPEEYNDVYLLRDNLPCVSYHHIDGQQFRISLTGGGNGSTMEFIYNAIGFNYNVATEIKNRPQSPNQMYQRELRNPKNYIYGQKPPQPTLSP